jgi:hypothetical protein
MTAPGGYTAAGGGAVKETFSFFDGAYLLSATSPQGAAYTAGSSVSWSASQFSAALAAPMVDEDEGLIIQPSYTWFRRPGRKPERRPGTGKILYCFPEMLLKGKEAA